MLIMIAVHEDGYSNEKEIKLKMINVQKQLGGCDCGLFAIAIATTLAVGNQPEQCFFDQAAMRRHLYALNALPSRKCLCFHISRGE